jgi:hypothetical protein
MTELLTIDLCADAVLEARRLSELRSLIPADDGRARATFDAARPLIARARRSGVRRRLGGRLLLIFRLTAQDAGGRTIDAHVMGALVSTSGAAGSRRRDAIRASVRDATAAARPHVDVAAATWRGRVDAVCSAFAATRLRREHAIWAAVRASAPGSFQPGLFDRRAERAHQSKVDADAARDGRLRARLHAAAAGRVAVHIVELALVLTP